MRRRSSRSPTRSWSRSAPARRMRRSRTSPGTRCRCSAPCSARPPRTRTLASCSPRGGTSPAAAESPYLAKLGEDAGAAGLTRRLITGKVCRQATSGSKCLSTGDRSSRALLWLHCSPPCAHSPHQPEHPVPPSPTRYCSQDSSTTKETSSQRPAVKSKWSRATNGRKPSTATSPQASPREPGPASPATYGSQTSTAPKQPGPTTSSPHRDTSKAGPSTRRSR